MSSTPPPLEVAAERPEVSVISPMGKAEKPRGRTHGTLVFSNHSHK